MSIIDLGNATAVVHVPTKTGTVDRYNEPVYTLVDYTVTVVALPVTVDERTSVDDWAEDVVQIFARSWPGGAKATITLFGRDWDQVGEAQSFLGPFGVPSHSRVLARAKTTVG